MKDIILKSRKNGKLYTLHHFTHENPDGEWYEVVPYKHSRKIQKVYGTYSKVLEDFKEV